MLQVKSAFVVKNATHPIEPALLQKTGNELYRAAVANVFAPFYEVFGTGARFFGYKRLQPKFIRVCRPIYPDYVCEPRWTLTLFFVVLAIVAFYTIAYVRWVGRKRAIRMTNTEQAKHFSEHGNFLGTLVETAIHHFDQQMIGVNVDFTALNVKVLEGMVEIVDFTIENPDGYWSDYFVHVGHCLVDIDMEAYALSAGKKVIVQRLEICNVDVVWERGFSTSNLNDILNFFKSKQGKKPEEKSSEQAPEAASSSKSSHESSGRSTEVLEVAMQKISMKLAFHKLAGCGARIASSDIMFDNFTQEMNSGKVADEIIPLLTKTLITSLLSNLIGEDATHAMFAESSSIMRVVVGSCWHLLLGTWLFILFIFRRTPPPNDDKTKPQDAKDKQIKKGQGLSRMLSDAFRKTFCHEDKASEQASPQEAAGCMPGRCSVM